MTHRKAIAFGLPILLATSLSFKCGGDSKRATQRQYAAFLREFDAVAVKANKQVSDSFRENQISAAEKSLLEPDLEEENDYKQAAASAIDAMTHKNAPDEDTVQKLLYGVFFALNRLNDKVSTLQNPDAKAKLRRIIEPITVAGQAFHPRDPSSPSLCEKVGNCLRCRPDPCIYCGQRRPSCPPR